MIREIESRVRAVRRRLRVLRFYRGVVWGASIATAVVALAYLVDKIYPLPWTADEKWMAWGAAVGVGVLVAAVYALVSRLTLFQAALATDLRLGLQERFSSAILLRNRADDPAVAALLTDTHQFCKRIHPTKDFPFLLPPRYAHHLWPLAALLLIQFVVPNMNLFATADTAKKQQIAEVPKSVREKQAEKIEKMAKKVKENAEGKQNDDLMKIAKDLDKLAQDLKAGEKDPKLAMAEMSRLSEEVRVDRSNLSKKFEAYQNLQSPVSSQNTRDLQQAMQRNQFEKAAQMAKEMAAKMSEDSTASDKENTAKELQDMAKQLAKDQPDLAKSLEKAAEQMQKAADAQNKGDQAGMKDAASQAQEAMQQSSKELSNQADAAQQMQQLDQLQQSMEQQKRELAKSCGLDSGTPTGQSNDSERAGNASETGQMQQGQGSNGQMQASGEGSPQGSQGQGMRPGNRAGGQGQSGAGTEGGTQMGQRLGSSTATGSWQPGQSEMTGMGMGGPGRGSGGKAPFDDSNKPGFLDTRPPGEKNPGEIIAVMNVDGPAVKGESKLEYQKVFTEYKQKADDAMSREDIPANLQPMVRDYFDAISPEAISPNAANKPPAANTESKPAAP